VKVDVILAGVGGQGVLTAAAILAEAGRRCGLTVKQGEIHGMSQRGGAVSANLRMNEGPVASDLIPKGAASMILSLEPVEALRWLAYLAPHGVVVSSSSPVRNIGDYPDREDILSALSKLPHSVVVEADPLARAVGSVRANNVVMLGAAAGFLPVPQTTLEACVVDFFTPKGEKVVALNRGAFAAGVDAAAVSVL
jgi:indolepyruvate ferredoxin oxidoreductase beta subunit